ncbi:hypothetical protein D5H75_11705 [Bailinhaonella thermotolerans]|uniref:Uncharacterized protein n=1 Tax=Bailinhaonella thermotolerans TaxID=1070861 RepID=A0A3A4AV14_9ACTN|nr:hypothetical protein D5H75_11705 [Bailinhaonella thermotolerans]
MVTAEEAADLEERGEVVVAASLREIAEAARAGRAVLVTPADLAAGDDGDEPDAAAETAAASLCAWAGATYFRTNRPAEVQQALDMTASIRGDRPPALTRRALA